MNGYALVYLGNWSFKVLGIWECLNILQKSHLWEYHESKNVRSSIQSFPHFFFSQRRLRSPGILTNINYHGALLLQQLLNFGNPRVVVTQSDRVKTGRAEDPVMWPVRESCDGRFLPESVHRRKGERTNDQQAEGLKKYKNAQNMLCVFTP